MSKNLFAHLLHCLLLLRQFFFYLKWVPKLDSVHIQCCSLSFLLFFRKGLLLNIVSSPICQVDEKGYSSPPATGCPASVGREKEETGCSMVQLRKTLLHTLDIPSFAGNKTVHAEIEQSPREKIRAKQKGLHARHVFFNRTLTRAGNKRGSCCRK